MALAAVLFFGVVSAAWGSVPSAAVASASSAGPETAKDGVRQLKDVSVLQRTGNDTTPFEFVEEAETLNTQGGRRRSARRSAGLDRSEFRTAPRLELPPIRGVGLLGLAIFITLFMNAPVITVSMGSIGLALYLQSLLARMDARSLHEEELDRHETRQNMYRARRRRLWIQNFYSRSALQGGAISRDDSTPATYPPAPAEQPASAPPPPGAAAAVKAPDAVAATAPGAAVQHPTARDKASDAATKARAGAATAAQKRTADVDTVAAPAAAAAAPEKVAVDAEAAGRGAARMGGGGEEEVEKKESSV